METITVESLLPDWNKAQIHAKAVNVRKPIHDTQFHRVCQCCNNVIDREQIGLGSNIKNLSFLGFGVPLYFLFLQYCIILNLLLIVTDGIIMVQQAYSNNSERCNAYYAVNPATTTTTTTTAAHTLGVEFMHLRDAAHFAGALAHKMDILCHNPFVYIANLYESTSITEVLARVSSFIIHLFFLIYVKTSLFKTGEYYNEISIDLADYSVMFRDLPKHHHGKRAIIDSILKSIIVQGHQIGYYDIIIVPEGEELQELLHEKEHVLSEFLHLRHQNQEEAKLKFKEYQHVVHKIKETIHKYMVEFRQDRIQSENIIVVFNTENDRELFMNEQNQLIVRDKLTAHFGYEAAEEIVIQQASGPKEIMWHHLKHTKTKTIKVIRGWALSLLFLFLVLVIFYFLSQLKANLLANAGHSSDPDTSQTQRNWATAVAWMTLIGIVLFNKFVMGTVFHHFTHLQHHDDKADEDFSFAFKYALGMFFTTCLMTVTVQAVMHKNYYSHKFGVIEQQSLMFIFSSILVPMIWLIHPYHLAHAFKRWRNQGSSEVTQMEANELMANYQYSVGKRYAEVIEMMWFTFLYVDLIPAGTIMIFFGLCAYYWVDKFNLLRRSSASHNVSAKLSSRVSDLIDLTLFWRFCGEILFDYQLKGKVNPVSFVLLGFSILYVLLPVRSIMSCVASEQFNKNDKRIGDVWDSHFRDDNYKTMNPIYVQILRESASMSPVHGSSSHPKTKTYA